MARTIERVERRQAACTIAARTLEVIAAIDEGIASCASDASWAGGLRSRTGPWSTSSTSWTKTRKGRCWSTPSVTAPSIGP